MSEFAVDGFTKFLCVDLTGVAATTGGGIASVLNPFGCAAKILRSYLYIVTPSTGAANVNIGVGSTATTDASDMISALAINGSITGKIYNGNTIQGTTKTEASAPATWGAAEYVNVTGSATSAGFVGKLFIEALPVGY